jgi:hypothetical protein
VISRALRRTQETQVLEAIIAAHLNPFAFEWELVDSLDRSETRVPRLFHTSRQYSFLFDVMDPDGYFLDPLACHDERCLMRACRTRSTRISSYCAATTTSFARTGR